MGRADAVRRVSAMLMGAFNEIEDYQPGQEVQAIVHSVVTAPSGRRFLLLANPLNRICQAARKLSPFLDYYPLEKCQDRLRKIVVAEKDAGTIIQQVQTRLTDKITEFLDTFETVSEWEVLFAVRGIDPSETNFTVGSCEFYRMDNSKFELWGRRCSSGTYSPPSDAPIPGDWVSDEEPVRDQVVAVTRVHAADKEHAFTKAKNRIEEAINVLRYGQLITGTPDRPFPQIGLHVKQWHHDYSLAMCIDTTEFTTNRTLGGPEGNTYSDSREAPGWAGWDNLIRSDLSTRTELGVRLSIALQWFGQAAVSPTISVRLVAMVIALEAALIEQGESQGKKSKLSRRISRLIGVTDEEKEQIASQVVTLYGIRSDCVHEGLVDVEKDVMVTAIRLVGRTIEALFSKPPINTMISLKEVVEHLDGPDPGANRKRWISDNAYFRYRAIVDDPGKDRSLQHWIDAEREYNSQRLTPTDESNPDD